VAVVVGFRSVGWERGMGGNELRPKSWFVLVTYHLGLPLPGSPLVFLLPRFLRRAIVSRPHPSGKGRGGRGSILACEGAVTMLTEPTSLNRGEGLMTGSPDDVGGSVGASEGGGGWRRGGGKVVVDEQE
jgi:hypothetical protein